MAFQVCTRDEYGQTANVSDAKFANVPEAVSFIKKAVTSNNIDNALTLDEKRRHWTGCSVQLYDAQGELDENVVYAGKGLGAKEMVYLLGKDDAPVLQTALSDTDAKVKIFIGTVFEFGSADEWYAQDQRGKAVERLDDDILNGKTVYYIKQVP